jgi:hypothetical protein
MTDNKLFIKLFLFFLLLPVFSSQAAGLGCCQFVDNEGHSYPNLAPGSYMDLPQDQCRTTQVGTGNNMYFITYQWVANGIKDSNNMCQAPQPLPQTKQPPSKNITMNLQIPIPPDFKSVIEIGGNSLGEYILSLYQFFTGAIAILAVIMIMIAGYRWLLSSGSSERVSKSKDMIINAVVGLILALTSYILLYTLNPNLVKLKSLNIPYIDPSNSSSVEGTVALQSIRGTDYEFYGTQSSPLWLPETAAALDRAISELKNQQPPIKLLIESGSRNQAQQISIYQGKCGAGTVCGGSCTTACNPYCADKNCSHANAVDITTSGYTTEQFEKVKQALHAQGFCKYTLETNHFEFPRWTDVSLCTMDYITP